jgi:phage-related minor tail protein
MLEEVGIRLRTDGTVEATNGVALLGKALDLLGPAAGAAAPEVAGVGTAASGALAALTPLTATAGAAAVAVGVLAIAYNQGAKEAQAFERAIILTGNAAGATEGMLQAMAGRVSAIVGTQAQAASIVAQLVSTGNVSREQIEIGTRAAIGLERSLGVEAEKTVKALAELGKDPLKASIKLNEQYRFLTLSTYEQIKALDEQGKRFEAAAVAQQTFSKTANERVQEMETHLGTLQKAWRGVTEFANKAWDAMLGIGRKRTTEEELASVEAALAAPQRRGGNNLQADARRKALEEQRDFLKQMLADQADGAAMQAQIAQRVQEKIAADQKKEKPAGAAPADPYKAVNEQISRYLVLAAAELEAGRKLTALEQFEAQLLDDIRKARQTGDQEGADLTKQRIMAVRALGTALEGQHKQEQLNAELEKKRAAERAQTTQAAQREVLTLQQQRDTMVEETAQIGLGTMALVERKQAQIDAQIAAKQARIERIDGLPAYAEEAAALRQQIELLGQIRTATYSKGSAQVRQQEIEENKRRTDSIADSILDGVANGFRDGRRPADIFLNEIKAQFARTFLKVPVQFLAQSFTNDVGKLFSWLTGGPSTFGSGLPMPGFDRVGEGFHAGGIAGGTPTFTRSVHASTFNGG